ncbi:MAG: hypothetical protein IKO22_01445 [Oscillospiraceae bacterium]|nr:hypothetical protein [Oscillospiraceae bacterium]
MQVLYSLRQQLTERRRIEGADYAICRRQNGRIEQVGMIRGTVFGDCFCGRRELFLIGIFTGYIM